MSWTVDYKNFESPLVLIRTFSGTVTMENIISSWKYLIKKKIVTPDHIGVISDYRNSEFQIERKDVEKLYAFLNENFSIFDNLYLAQIVDSPKITFPKLFALYHSEFKSQAFSTRKAALNWMGV